MVKNCRGANDGISTKEYIAGQSYEFSEGLAKNFLAMGVAKKPKQENIQPAEPDSEEGKKSEQADLKNKAIQSGDLKNKNEGAE